MAITASEARKRLFPLIKQVNHDRAPVEIISNHGRAYLVAADDYESMEETDYLLRSPANATRLMAAADEVRHGRNCSPRPSKNLRPWPTRTSRVEEHRLPPARLGGLHLLGHRR